MTDTWKPADQAPDRVTVLCRSGANVYFAGRIDGVWFNDQYRVVHPQEYFHHTYASPQPGLLPALNPILQPQMQGLRNPISDTTEKAIHLLGSLPASLRRNRTKFAICDCGDSTKHNETAQSR